MADTNIQLKDATLGNLSEVGLLMKFGDQNSLKTLRDAIKEAIKQEDTNRDADPDKPTSKAAGRRRRKHEEDVEKQLNGIKKSIDNPKYNWKAVAKEIMTEVTSHLKVMYKESERRFSWLQDLENSGVKLTDGFDKSFTQLTNDSKMQHEQFVGLLKSNSGVIAKLNSAGVNGVKEVSKATGNIVGKFGLDAASASKAVSGYLDSLSSKNLEEYMRTHNITLETEKYAKKLKELSVLTGKQVDMVIEENKIKEDSLLSARINSDDKLRPLFNALKAMGYKESVINALISERPNSDLSKMMITPEARNMVGKTQDIISKAKRGEISGKDLYIALEKARSENRDAGMRRVTGMNVSQASALAGSPLEEGLMSSYNVFKNRFDVNGLKNINSTDTNLLNGYNNNLSQKVIWENNKQRALSMDLGTADYFNKLNSMRYEFLNGLVGNKGIVGSISRGILGLSQTSGGQNLLSRGWGYLSSKLSGIKYFSKEYYQKKIITDAINESKVADKNGIGGLTNNFSGRFMVRLRNLFRNGFSRSGFADFFKSNWKDAVKGSKTLLKSLPKVGSALLKFAGKALVVVGAITSVIDFFQSLSDIFDKNKSSQERWGAGGKAIGMVGGGALGFFLGGPVGAVLGAQVGGWLGEKLGGFIGDKIGPSPAESTQLSSLSNSVDSTYNQQGYVWALKQDEDEQYKKTVLQELNNISGSTGSSAHHSEEIYKETRLNSVPSMI